MTIQMSISQGDFINVMRFGNSCSAWANIPVYACPAMALTGADIVRDCPFHGRDSRWQLRGL